MRAHFTEQFLSLVPTVTIISTLTRATAAFREELVVTQGTPLGVRAQVGGLALEAAAEPDPPNRLSELAAEALRPQAQRDASGAQMGLGWLLHQGKDLAGHAGGGPGAATSLILQLGSGRVCVAMANRLVPIEPVNARLFRPIT